MLTQLFTSVEFKSRSRSCVFNLFETCFLISQASFLAGFKAFQTFDDFVKLFADLFVYRL